MLDATKKALIAATEDLSIYITPQMANRHGLITGATGTGKTVTLQTLAETFSAMGVPVFAADAKGDLSGVAAVGGNKESVKKRVTEYNLAKQGFSFQSFPVTFWDILGKQGIPVRAPLAEMGPMLLSRMLRLNETQTAVLTVIFKIAQDQHLELITLADLKIMLEYAANNATSFTTRYGNISPTSIGTIQRSIVSLEHSGVDIFFGEPGLRITDLLQTYDGKGVINILAADKLINSPKTYSTFLLWLMTKLFDSLPETGDLEKPKLVFFFDEAHLLFTDAPKVLLEKVEQVVRLIRSKGVGIYFISQTPSDIPDSVLGQLGNRIQHALRAYTPKDQKALKAAAQTFRANPGFDTELAISQLETGEALLSLLDEKGAPQPVERAFIIPPEGHIGPLDAEERKRLITASPLYSCYATEIRRQGTASSRLAAPSVATPDKNELAKQEKEELRERKALEKERIAVEKQAKREAEQQKKFWMATLKSILVPFARQALKTLFKSRR